MLYSNVASPWPTLSRTLLALGQQAGLFVILTNVTGVYLDWGKPEQCRMGKVTIADLIEHPFPAGSKDPTLAGDLPTQHAQAGLVNQDIQEINNRLSDAAILKGNLAVQMLDAAITQFNQTLTAVDQAAHEADPPAAEAVFDRIYGVLVATHAQLTNSLLTARRKQAC